MSIIYPPRHNFYHAWPNWPKYKSKLKIISISSISMQCRKYWTSSNCHFSQKIPRYFYINIFTLWEKKLILNLLSLLHAFAISFAAANLLFSKLIMRLGGPPSLVLAILFAVKYWLEKTVYLLWTSDRICSLISLQP